MCPASNDKPLSVNERDFRLMKLAAKRFGAINQISLRLYTKSARSCQIIFSYRATALAASGGGLRNLQSPSGEATDVVESRFNRFKSSVKVRRANWTGGSP